jgi:hypothetical protein
MLTEKDIYAHLKNHGSIKELHIALDNEIKNARARIEEDRAREEAAAKAKAEKETARKTAIDALLNYCKAVGADYSEKDLGSLVDMLEKNNIIFRQTEGKSRGDLYDLFGLFRY